MDTTQLDQKITAPGFLGAFPYDQIPPKPDSEVFSVILNTDPVTEPGDHWIALVYKAPYFYFCDSYGRTLRDSTFSSAFSTTVKSFIGKTMHKTNTKFLQQLTSNACGDYCVYFIQELAKTSFARTTRVFSTNLKSNDRFVENYVNNLI
jgi:hypothetical protein